MYYTSSEDEPELESLDISNDQYYSAPTCQLENLQIYHVPCDKPLQIPKYGSKTIRHSLPAYDLWKAFFPTYMSEGKYRNFHRPKLRHYNNGPQAMTRWGAYKEHPVKSLSRHIFRCHNILKSKVISAIDSGMSREDIISRFLQIKEAREISGKSGELFLFEYCEEYPPVLGQVGMASNIKTYRFNAPQRVAKKLVCPRQQQKGPGAGSTSNTATDTNGFKESQAQTFRSTDGTNHIIGYEETVKSEKQSKQIYYSQMKQGSSIRVIENNLYRAPIYEHELSKCDFIIIRTRNSFYIRPAKTIFTVGQTIPLAVIPSPSESQIHRFRCDLSNVYMHKLFMASETQPPSLKINYLAKLFPDYHMSVLARRLRTSGATSGIIDKELVYLKGDSSYGSISLETLRGMVYPEAYCLNMSMLAARQRLRELNYTESMINPPKEVELEPEVLAAPWNTSKAVRSALVGSAYLDLERHLIDPTGTCREGFSCVAWIKSPTEEQQAKEMSSQSAKRQINSPSAKIAFEKNPLRGKITQEKLRRLAIFQKEAQLVSDVQSRVLSLNDTLTSSEDECDVEDDYENLLDSEFNQQLDDLSRLVVDGRSVGELNYEKEEEERRQMLTDFKRNGLNNLNASAKSQTDNCASKDNSEKFNLASIKNKVMVITRTYDHAGRKIQRTEIVREPRIIALYVKQKGGSLTTSQATTNDHSQGGGDQNDNSMLSTRSDGPLSQSQARPRSSSLGPSELCRAEGTIIRISKKVLEQCRPVRNCRRQSTPGL